MSNLVKRLLWASCIVFGQCGLFAASAVTQVTWTSSPALIITGSSYTISATSVHKNGSRGTLTLRRNGVYVTSKTATSGTSVTKTYTDTVSQDVVFSAEVEDMLGNFDYISYTAVITKVPDVSFDSTATAYNGGNAIGSGWAADPEDGAPVARVRVWFDGSYKGLATLGGDRADVSTAYNRSDYRYSGFNYSFPISGYALGSHTVKIRAEDNDGTYVDKTLTFSVANTLPSTTLSADSTQLYAGQATVIHLHTTDPDANAQWADLQITSPITGTYGAGSDSVNALSPNNASHYLISNASDNMRNVTVSFTSPGIYVFSGKSGDSVSSSTGGSVTITVPNRTPSLVSHNIPASMTNGSSQSFTFTATDADNNLGFITVRYRNTTSSSAWKILRASDVVADNPAWATDSSYGIVSGSGQGTLSKTRSWAPDLGPGVYEINLYATDGLGAQSSRTVNMTVLNRTPSVVAYSIPASMINGNSQSFTFSATDADSNLGFITVRYRNTTTNSAWKILRAGDSVADNAAWATNSSYGIVSGSGLASLSKTRTWVPDLGVGIYELIMYATDTMGAQSSVTANMDVTNQKPLVTVESVTSGYQSGVLYVAGWAADYEDGAPVVSVGIWIDSVHAGYAVLGAERSDIVSSTGRSDYLQSGFNYQLSLAGYSIGSHELKIRSYDSASAYTQVVQSFEVYASPAVELSPKHTSVISIGQSIAYTSTATAALGGITSHRLQVLVPGSGSWSVIAGGTITTSATHSLSYTYTPSAVGVFQLRAQALVDGVWLTSDSYALQVLSPDADGDGIPEDIEGLLGTTDSTSNASDGGNAAQLKVHHP